MFRQLTVIVMRGLNDRCGTNTIRFIFLHNFANRFITTESKNMLLIPALGKIYIDITAVSSEWNTDNICCNKAGGICRCV
jgi:hypothetical protein